MGFQFCCCWMNQSVHFFNIKLTGGLLNSAISVLIFCLRYLFALNRSMLKYPTLVVNLSLQFNQFVPHVLDTLSLGIPTPGVVFLENEPYFISLDLACLWSAPRGEGCSHCSLTSAWCIFPIYVQFVFVFKVGVW